MRALALVSLLATTLARADTSVDVAPRSPLGPACDAALAAAQDRFAGSERAIDFHVRERRVDGEYHWSDMCGVWGDYTIELAADLRAPIAWQWSRRRGSNDSFHRRGTRRSNGWRARLIVDGDSDDSLGQSFVAAFRPALDVCLATASQ